MAEYLEGRGAPMVFVSSSSEIRDIRDMIGASTASVAMVSIPSISESKFSRIEFTNSVFIHPSLQMFKREREAFNKMKDHLLEDPTYAGKFVAVYNGKIVDYDDDNGELAKRVYEKFGCVPIYIDKVEKERRVIRMPSPRIR